MKQHPALFEINTRVFLTRFGTSDEPARLSDVPFSYWESLAEKGIDLIWLMGVWKTCSSIVKECCFQQGLRDSYDRALRDWMDEDVIGSPYAVDVYEVNPAVGTREDLIHLHGQLNSLGMKLILDFIPNHLSADSAYIRQHPEMFLQCSDTLWKDDPFTYFRHKEAPAYNFAHGRDPFFPAWTDTVQINYFHDGARAFMIERMNDIAALCDGVRCDMAMLVLNNVFQNTWGGVLRENGFEKPKQEFWREAIATVGKNFPGFLFIAEAYWDLEWELQKLGFDFTYDKRLLDRLKNAPPDSIRSHLYAEYLYQKKSVRFLENHDEDRAITSLGKDRSIAAALLISTIPGMRFYHDGQFEGKKIKLPVQLGREPKEQPVKAIQETYNKLLAIVKKTIFHDGEWELIEASPSWETNNSYMHIIASQWALKQERVLIVVNYSSQPAQCRIVLDLVGFEENFTLHDLWNDKRYLRSSEEVQHTGLYIDLPPWGCHVLEY